MARRLIECVPNFSEGRNSENVEALAAAACSVPGVYVLDEESDRDHNRSVLTLAGEPDAILEAALRSVGKAKELIDLRRHKGAHPRIGATDVLPFVPVEGVTLEECVRLAEQAAEEIWRRFEIPVYLYEAAARRPDRTNLENIRKGQFEGLSKEVLGNPDRYPDVGGPQLHPSAGATVVGARKFLIAYNINLNTPDVEVANRIARAVRYSSGGFRGVKAMGVMLGSRNLAQVSMNLTDFEQTPVHRVFEAVRAEAERWGTSIAGSEIVGLIPKKALEMTADFYLRCENFRPEVVLENRLENVQQSAGLAAFLDALAAPTATPGGGSASAAAAAMAAALGAMVAGLSKKLVHDFHADRKFFAEAAERDAEAFRKVMAAYKAGPNERAARVEEALHEAARVPMEVAERAVRLRGHLQELKSQAPAKFESDLTTALGLVPAAIQGALANVRINLESIGDAEFRGQLAARVSAIESE